MFDRPEQHSFQKVVGRSAAQNHSGEDNCSGNKRGRETHAERAPIHAASRPEPACHRERDRGATEDDREIADPRGAEQRTHQSQRQRDTYDTHQHRCPAPQRFRAMMQQPPCDCRKRREDPHVDFGKQQRRRHRPDQDSPARPHTPRDPAVAEPREQHGENDDESAGMRRLACHDPEINKDRDQHAEPQREMACHLSNQRGAYPRRPSPGANRNQSADGVRERHAESL